MVDTSGFIQEVPNPAKQWAKGFDTLKLFDQIVTLNNLYTTALNLELKLQILNLLNERNLQYYESLQVEERQLREQLGIDEKVKALTCGVPSPDGKHKCGLPASHTKNKPVTQHQSVNIHW